MLLAALLCLVSGQCRSLIVDRTYLVLLDSFKERFLKSFFLIPKQSICLIDGNARSFSLLPYTTAGFKATEELHQTGTFEGH